MKLSTATGNYFYPRSPCGERQHLLSAQTRTCYISIHALLAESDPTVKTGLAYHRHFYPRSPCGERPARSAPVQRNTRISIHALLAESDTSGGIAATPAAVFLSTLSLRRATLVTVKKSIKFIYFYPRSPCGERLPKIIVNLYGLTFLSTLSLRRATSYNLSIHHKEEISIHALLAESDANHTSFTSKISDFYPRSPCGERH